MRAVHFLPRIAGPPQAEVQCIRLQPSYAPQGQIPSSQVITPFVRNRRKATSVVIRLHRFPLCYAWFRWYPVIESPSGDVSSRCANNRIAKVTCR